MSAKLNRRSQQRLKRVTESVDNITKLVNRLKLSDIEELIRRDQITVEPGTMSSSSGFAGGSRGSKNNSSPVERAVIARLEGKSVRDPLREEVRHIEGLIIDAENALQKIHQTIKFLNENVEKARSRTTSDPCEICMVLPAAKTAMCFDCYKEWVENGSPDRMRWRAYKRQLTSVEGIPLSPDKPPARHPVRNI